MNWVRNINDNSQVGITDKKKKKKKKKNTNIPDAVLPQILSEYQWSIQIQIFAEKLLVHIFHICLSVICVTDQETLTYSNLCGLYMSLAPELFEPIILQQIVGGFLLFLMHSCWDNFLWITLDICYRMRYLESMLENIFPRYFVHPEIGLLSWLSFYLSATGDRNACFTRSWAELMNAIVIALYVVHAFLKRIIRKREVNYPENTSAKWTSGGGL